MRTEEETSNYLDITFRATPDLQILNLSRELSRLFSGRQVHIQPVPGSAPFGIMLRVHWAGTSVDSIASVWPVVRCSLRRENLLHQCTVRVRAPNLEGVDQLWPPPDPPDTSEAAPSHP